MDSSAPLPMFGITMTRAVVVCLFFLFSRNVTAFGWFFNDKLATAGTHKRKVASFMLAA